MDTLITAIVSIVIGAIINELIRFFIPVWKSQTKKVLPKKKSTKLRIKVMIKYPFLIALIFLIVRFICFGVWFSIALFSMGVVFSIFIARDTVVYLLVRASHDSEKENIENEIERWMIALGRCDPNDRDQQTKIKGKINELKKQGDSI
jgi:hypothetical protein